MTTGNFTRQLLKRRLLLLACLWAVVTVVVSVPAATTNYVHMEGVRFVPNDITISPGDTVIWTGNSTVHTVHGTGSDPLCGGTWIYNATRCVKTFGTAGTFSYKCDFHSVYNMTGVVRVLATNTPPTTLLIQPLAGSVFATDQVIKLIATARDTNGSVATVLFASDGTSLGTVTNSAAITNNMYSQLASNFTAGNHALTSLATDNLGATGSSTPVSIFVISPITSMLTSSGLTNGLYHLTYTADPGLSYALQASTNLVDWVSLVTNKAVSTNLTFIDSSATNFGTRFYRSIRLKPLD